MSNGQITNTATDKIMEYTKRNGEMIKAHRLALDDLDQTIRELKRIRKNMEYPHWKHNSFEEIGRVLAKELGTENWRVSGCYGLSREDTTFLFGIGPEAPFERVCQYAITLVPVDFDAGRFAYLDYSGDTRVVQHGVLRPLDAKNFSTVEITEDMTIADLAEVIRKQKRVIHEG